MFHIQSITDSLEMEWQETKATAFYLYLSLSVSALTPSLLRFIQLYFRLDSVLLSSPILIQIASIHSELSIPHSS